MRDDPHLDEWEFMHAKAWRPSGRLLAGMVTSAISLLAVGVLFGAFVAAASRF